MTDITVNAERKYIVKIGDRLLECTGRLVREVTSASKIAVVTDDIVDALYAETVIASLNKEGISTCKFVFKNGEASKNMQTLTEVLEFFAQNELTRQDAAIALGGGVVGDLTGFAASVYLRGMDFIQIPTTLLAAVDSSVGGKTAVDLKNGKNLAGSFYSPRLVICDCSTLDTLSDDNMACGLAEAIKYGVLFDKELFDKIKNGGIKTDREGVIAGCVELKRRTVENDLYDRGERQLLNLGHTAGHAIEKCSGYKIYHGMAVSIGMAIIARAAKQLGQCSADCCDEIISALQKLNLPTETEYSAQQLAAAALNDKKRSLDTINLVMVESVGSCFLKKIPVSEILGVFEAGLK